MFFTITKIFFSIATRLIARVSIVFRVYTLFIYYCLLLIRVREGEAIRVEIGLIGVVSGSSCCPRREASPWEFMAVLAILLSRENLKLPY